MTGESDIDEPLDPAEEAIEQHSRAIFELVGNYLDEEGLHEGLAAHLLFSLAVNMRLSAYCLGVEKPSVGGLKLDLDRFRGEIDQTLRSVKKDAQDYIDRIMPALDEYRTTEKDEGGDT